MMGGKAGRFQPGRAAMRGDDVLATIEAIHAAGLNNACWPQALAGVANAVGGGAATLEVFDKQTLRPREIYCHGVPPAHEIKYLDHYAALNPRLAVAARLPLGDVHWDWRMFDDAAIKRDPFYMEFLGSLDLRYLVSGIVITNAREFAGVCVHRTPRQGHIDAAGIAAMQRLLPHVQQAFDVARRLKRAGETQHALEHTLDCLADGVALLRADGRLIYANESFQSIVRRADGIRLRKGMIEIVDAEARDKFNVALAAVRRLRAGEPDRASGADFFLVRSADGGPYLVSLRPLLGRAGPRHSAQAVAIVFVHDTRARSAMTGGALRELFSLTEAETLLAQALQSGVTLADYARMRALSLNTVYTHLRRLREKTGCNRMTELIHKLDELRSPLRLD